MVQPKQKFVLDDTAIEQALALVPGAPKPEDMQVNLDLSQCKEKAIDQDFVCSICHFVVWDVTQCGECENMFCQNCIKASVSIDKRCPNCRKDYVGSKVGRILTNKLHGSSFKCNVAGCSDTFKYLEAAQHAANHAIAEIKCVLNCDSTLRFKGRDAMKIHLETKCAKSCFKCTDCNIKIVRAEQPNDNHSCELQLLKASDQSKTELLKTKLIEQLVEKTNSQEAMIKSQTQLINQQGKQIQALWDWVNQQKKVQQQDIKVEPKATQKSHFDEEQTFKNAFDYKENGITVEKKKQQWKQDYYGKTYQIEKIDKETLKCNRCQSKMAIWFDTTDQKINFCSYSCYANKK